MKPLNLHLLGPLIALVALFILGALLNPAFLAPANLSNVLARSAFIGLIAVGMTFVITSGGLDLSVGAMAAFLAGLAILAMNGALPLTGANWGTVLLGMGVAILGGLAAGAAMAWPLTSRNARTRWITAGAATVAAYVVIWVLTIPSTLPVYV